MLTIQLGNCIKAGEFVIIYVYHLGTGWQTKIYKINLSLVFSKSCYPIIMKMQSLYLKLFRFGNLTASEKIWPHYGEEFDCNSINLHNTAMELAIPREQFLMLTSYKS